MIIPKPTQLDRLPGEFVLNSTATIGCRGEAGDVARLWREVLSPATGLGLPRVPDGGTLRLVLDRSAGLADEGYRLSVHTERVLAVASASNGLRNALQTVRQLLPAAVYRHGPVRGVRWALPCVEIDDSPRFRWRGALLDVARQFMPAPFLFRLVDLLAMHKLNVLHLHLTDDQGWRFPSSAYPRLTETSSWRRETIIGHEHDHGSGPRFDGTPHGGYYSREELKDLVSYAAERNVTVVPEIDLPGHVQAAIAAYPELGCTDQKLEVRTHWGISEHVLNLSEHALRFCQDILCEVMEVFPARYIHVGGDECPRTEWRQSASVQERIASLGLVGEDALQNWFTRQMNSLLRSRGRTLVGWDEILEGGPLPGDAVVMSWRGTSGGVAAARAGLNVVMCPEQPCYFDHYQSRDSNEPLAIHGLNTLEQVYAFDPLPAGLSPQEAAHVLGTQFLLWTCYTPTPSDVEYMAFPRAAALAEAAWSAQPREFAEFRHRLSDHLRRLDAFSVNYRPLSGPLPWQEGGTGARRRYDPVYTT